MRNSVAALAFAFCSIVSLTAHAQDWPGDFPAESPIGPKVVDFFKRLEGGWDGEGAMRALQADGSLKTIRFDIELDVDDDWQDDSWKARTETRYETGMTEIQDTWFAVQGNTLFTNQEPILVEEVSETTLVYSFDRIAYPAPSPYHFVFRLEFTDAQTLRVYAVIKRNGVRIEERLWTVKR